MKKINNKLVDLPFGYLRGTIKPKKLTGSFKADVIVVGGGMAGIAAAQSFNDKGYSVVLLERYFCGSGATGKSGGFVTPDGELGLRHLTNIYGHDSALKLWEFVASGVKHIRANIKKYGFDCDYQDHNAFIAANCLAGLKEIEQEHETRKKFNYHSVLYDEYTLPHIIGSSQYFGGVRYDNTFGIIPYMYVQGMKDVLIENGVDVYEEVTVTKINPHSVRAQDIEIYADYIIICGDYDAGRLNGLANQTYHAQNFVMVSSPLTDAQIQQIFPQDNLMVWDTDIVYQFYRLIQNNRLLLGGGSIPSFYAPYQYYNDSRMYRNMHNKLISYCKKKFPSVILDFNYMWTGLFGISKDMMPIAGFNSQSRSIYYIACSAGLAWATRLGSYSAECIMDGRNDMDSFFLPTRSFPIGPVLQKIIGKPFSFAFSNFMAVYCKAKKT